MRQRDAFNPFADDGGINESGKPASSQWGTWGHDLHNTTLNTTFDTHTFDYSAASSMDGTNDLLEGPVLFPEDPMTAPPPILIDGKKRKTVHVAMHEQLSCLYDGGANTHHTQVEGSIHVRTSVSESFCLRIRDRSQQLATFQEDIAVCDEITRETKGSSFIKSGERVLRIQLPGGAAQQTKVASYSCIQALRPIPMLIKSKVQPEATKCRVGIKIRSNPSNLQPLTQMAILMAVPPDIRGETVKLTRQGGVWDGMKRTISWSVDRLGPGELLEIQAQFEYITPGDDRLTTPKFPVLVRCDVQRDQFSDIQLSTDYADERATSVKMKLSRTVRILHRKV